MIRNAMFYLNQNKPSVNDTVRVCAELCRARGIEPIFFEDDREELVEKLGEEAENARYLHEPDAQMVDMLFVFGGDGTVLQAARESAMLAAITKARNFFMVLISLGCFQLRSRAVPCRFAFSIPHLRC